MNGKRLCTAGVQDDESLSVDVCHTPKETFMSVGGCTGAAGDFSKWIQLMSLNMGDEIRIKVTNTSQIDEPVSIERGKLKKL